MVGTLINFFPTLLWNSFNFFCGKSVSVQIDSITINRHDLKTPNEKKLHDRLLHQRLAIVSKQCTVTQDFSLPTKA